jgi:hypothetical protein
MSILVSPFQNKLEPLTSALLKPDVKINKISEKRGKKKEKTRKEEKFTGGTTRRFIGECWHAHLKP